LEVLCSEGILLFSLDVCFLERIPVFLIWIIVYEHILVLFVGRIVCWRPSCVFRWTHYPLDGFFSVGIIIYESILILFVGLIVFWRDSCVLRWKYYLLKELLRVFPSELVSMNILYCCFCGNDCFFFEGVLVFFVGSIISWNEYCVFSLNLYLWVESFAFSRHDCFFGRASCLFSSEVFSFEGVLVFFRLSSYFWIASSALTRNDSFLKWFVCFSLEVLSFERTRFSSTELLSMNRF